MTAEQRDAVLRMLARGEDRETIATAVGVTPGQVSAVAAHVKMGTYSLPEPDEAEAVLRELPRTTNLLGQLQNLEGARGGESKLEPILLGVDGESGEEVFWNPDPGSGTPNPHVLILGESGTGKTYAISCLTAELARERVVSIIFDYGQGFSARTLPREFVAATDLVELHTGRDGVDINPLQIFPSDLHGPVNVAQRVADTFARVYKRMGVQQHAAVRQAVLDVMADVGIVPEAPNSWSADLPAFGTLQSKLLAHARDPLNPQARFAASAASHVSTVFVFNTFRSNGQKLAWPDLLKPGNRVVVIQLKGLEQSLERAVTEFLLWNLIGFIEAMGPGPLRCFVVLDEAHKLSFRGSPVEKGMSRPRERFQQPEPFLAGSLFRVKWTPLSRQWGPLHPIVDPKNWVC